MPMLMYQLSCSSVSCPGMRPPTKIRSDVLIDQRGLEHPLERIDRNFRVGHRPIAVGVEGRDRLPELAFAIVLIRRGDEPSFGIDVEARASESARRCRLMPRSASRSPRSHRAGASPSSRDRWCGCCRTGRAWPGVFFGMHRREHRFVAEEFVIVVLDFRGEAEKRIRIEVVRRKFAAPPVAPTARRAYSADRIREFVGRYADAPAR